jgi:hypothetical protein
LIAKKREYDAGFEKFITEKDFPFRGSESPVLGGSE